MSPGLLEEMRFDGALPVDGYGPGFFRIAGEVVRDAVLLLPSGARSWGGWDDVAVMLAEGPRLDVLFVGTGAQMAILPPAFRRLMDDGTVPVEPMGTPPACRTYNVLLSEGRRVGLAALPV